MSSELPEEIAEVEEELDLEPEDPLFDEPTGEQTDDREHEESEPEPHEEFVICAIGDDRVAVHVDAVKQVVDLADVTRVPQSSDAIDGITDLRGEITAVIAPRVLYGVGPISDETVEQDVVVFQLGRDEGNSGLRIDRVTDVISVPVSQIVLDPSELPEDGTDVDRLLDSRLYAGLLERPDESKYTPLIDVEALVDASKSRVTSSTPTADGQTD